jgi:hypothetical protein
MTGGWFPVQPVHAFGPDGAKPVAAQFASIGFEVWK